MMKAYAHFKPTPDRAGSPSGRAFFEYWLRPKRCTAVTLRAIYIHGFSNIPPAHPHFVSPRTFTRLSFENPSLTAGNEQGLRHAQDKRWTDQEQDLHLREGCCKQQSRGSGQARRQQQQCDRRWYTSTSFLSAGMTRWRQTTGTCPRLQAPCQPSSVSVLDDAKIPIIASKHGRNGDIHREMAWVEEASRCSSSPTNIIGTQMRDPAWHSPALGAFRQYRGIASRWPYCHIAAEVFTRPLT
ncbi:uncharacterized protein MYCGRDRAFT_105892, partial [Zymoseptoria tritici IPO323]